MGNKLHAHQSVGWNYHPFTNVSGCNIEFWDWASNFILLYGGCNYLSMLGSKLIHIDKNGCHLISHIHLITQTILLNFMNQWWQHNTETFSILLTLCEGNPPITLKIFDNHDYISSAVYLMSCTRSLWYVVMPTWLIIPPMPLAKNGQWLISQTVYELMIEICSIFFCWI